MLPLTASANTSAFVPLPTSALQTPTPQEPAAVTTGVREAAWSPDGRRIAVTWYDAIWTMTPDGKDAKRLVPAAQRSDRWGAERDPVWMPDGKAIVFTVSINGEFSLWSAPAGGGLPTALTWPVMTGDERWPSMSQSGAMVVSSRLPNKSWRLYLFDRSGLTALTPETESAWHGRISPDGKLVAYVSDREAEPGNDADIWVREIAGAEKALPRRVTRAPGIESYPAWAPDNARIASRIVASGPE